MWSSIWKYEKSDLVFKHMPSARRTKGTSYQWSFERMAWYTLCIPFRWRGEYKHQLSRDSSIVRSVSVLCMSNKRMFRMLRKLLWRTLLTRGHIVLELHGTQKLVGKQHVHNIEDVKYNDVQDESYIHGATRKLLDFKNEQNAKTNRVHELHRTSRLLYIPEWTVHMLKQL